MKTVIIYDDCQANIVFFVIEKEFNHLDGIYINNVKNEDKIKEAELYNLIYDQVDGGYNYFPLKDFPTDIVKQLETRHVITCGIISA